MGIHFHVPGCKRKELAREIGTWLGCETKYLGVPSCAYRVGFATIDKDGNFTVDSAADEETVERLIEHLYDAGFESDDGGQHGRIENLCFRSRKPAPDSSRRKSSCNRNFKMRSF